MTWTLAPALGTLRTQINTIWADRSKTSDGTIGDAAHAARKSDHNPDSDNVVTAIDLTDDDSVGADMRQLAEHLRYTRDPRIKYVISEGKMFSSYSTSSRAAWTWGPYSGINGHFSHLHLSVTQAGKYDYAPWDLTPFEPKAPKIPRRFARVFEFSREEGREGTEEQQKAVRDALALRQKFYPRFDRVLAALDKARNTAGKHFIPIQFVELNTGVIGFATPTTISFAKWIHPSYLHGWLLFHELGHSVGWNVLYPKDGSEQWANAFEGWVAAGTPDGPVWDALKDRI